jgi:hypothetical protein
VITGSRCNLDKSVAVVSARICVVYHHRLSSGNGCSHHFLAPILIPKLVTVGVCIPANGDVVNICLLLACDSSGISYIFICYIATLFAV